MRAPSHSASPSRRGLARTHSIAIAAVAAVVVALTVSRLQLFAVYENERDAVTLLEYIGGQLGQPAVAATHGRYDLRSEVARAKVHVGNPADSQWLDEGRVLRRRGYLYDLVPDQSGGWALRAWPFRTGTTGVAAYAFTTADGLLGHTNGAGAPGAANWSGPQSPPNGPSGSAPDWLRLEDSRRLGLASLMR
jgi:hypothetical protein